MLAADTILNTPFQRFTIRVVNDAMPEGKERIPRWAFFLCISEVIYRVYFTIILN